YVSGGRSTMPVVFRTRMNDAGAQNGATHLQALEAFFYHVPGLKVVMPSTPADGKGLLLSAIREDDPVVFIECSSLDKAKRPVPTNDYAIPLGVADVKRPGRDVSVVAFGHTVAPALEVAAKLEPEGISVEVIDLRTIAPLDADTILVSVRRTGRLVVFQ